MAKTTRLEILFEDNHLVIVNKKSSDIVQGDKTGDVPLSERIKEYLKNKYEKPGNVFVGVIHRLDRPVSGAVAFAKTSKCLERMNEMFRQHDVQKIYWAVVRNKPEPVCGSLIHYLKKNEEQNKSYVYDEGVKGTQQSELSYRVIGKSERFFLLEVIPKTGRHHQIRVQLSAMGSPIKGDVKYGYERTNEGGAIHLHSRKMEFMHPVNKSMVQIIAPLPKDVIWNYFENKKLEPVSVPLVSKES
ncbi:MAG: RluA family pseudouridine synthase [Bacteroidia bacterium]|nr:RluA family pseudouridine synthase [Bacteroidia bacterium]